MSPCWLSLGGISMLLCSLHKIKRLIPQRQPGGPQAPHDHGERLAQRSDHPAVEPAGPGIQVSSHEWDAQPAAAGGRFSSWRDLTRCESQVLMKRSCLCGRASTSFIQQHRPLNTRLLLSKMKVRRVVIEGCLWAPKGISSRDRGCASPPTFLVLRRGRAWPEGSWQELAPGS